MDWVKARTHVIDHPRFLAAGSVARDLWTWGMLYAGLHETDGDLPMVAVMSSAWGKGGKANVLIANKLVEVGLWERTDAGFRVLRWTEQGNQTKAQIEADRAAARARKKPKGSPELLPNEQKTDAEVPTSTSLSSGSDLGSREGVQGGTVERTAVLHDDARAVFDGIAMNRPVGKSAEVTWLEFCGHFAGQTFASREAVLGRWQKWLVQQAGYSERDRHREREREDARKRRFDPPEPPKLSREQAQREAQQLQARITEARRKAAGQ